jgi:hypothetical protein
LVLARGDRDHGDFARPLMPALLNLRTTTSRPATLAAFATLVMSSSG